MMNKIKIVSQDQHPHNEPLFNILKKIQTKIAIKNLLIFRIKNDTEVEVTLTEDQDQISEITQEVIGIIQDQIQDPDTLNTQIDHTVHIHQDPDMIITKIEIQTKDQILFHNDLIEIITQVIIQNVILITTSISL